MLCQRNGAAKLKCRHDVERSLAISSHKLALSFGCAGKGLGGAGRHCFYLALLIACRAFAHVCSIIQSGKRTAASFRRIPRPQRPRDADDLPFAGRSEATVVDQKNGAGRQRIGLRIVTRVAPRRAAARPSRSLSSGSAAVSQLWYTTPASQQTCFRRGCREAGHHGSRQDCRGLQMAGRPPCGGRPGVRFSTAWKPS
jgi:hypothetical protein